MFGGPLIQLLSRSSLVFLLVWHPILHISYISSPNHRLFAAHPHTTTTCFVQYQCYVMLCYVRPYLSLSSLLRNLFYLNATHPPDHSHICLLKCHLIFFPYRPGLTFMQHTASHTTTVQPSSHNQ